MGTRIFLGKPPAGVEQWIKDHRRPVADPKTHIKFVDGTEGDYLIEGAMDCPALVEAGLMPPGSGTEQKPSWIKQPLEAAIGSAATSIGKMAFWSCTSLTSVTIPDSVTSVSDSAFYLCSSLTDVTIPDSVASIEESAFYNCSGLTSVTIGNGVTDIGNMAFFNCRGLTDVTIPESVTSIGNNAFSYCRGLTDVVFSGKTKAAVQGMEYYSWGLPSGRVLHCVDGDITV